MPRGGGVGLPLGARRLDPAEPCCRKTGQRFVTGYGRYFLFGCFPAATAGLRTAPRFLHGLETHRKSLAAPCFVAGSPAPLFAERSDEQRAERREPSPEVFVPEDREVHDAVGYAPAVRVGDLLHLSGVTGDAVARDADDAAPEANFVSIFEQIFEQIGATLAGAGIGFDQVVLPRKLPPPLREDLPPLQRGEEALGEGALSRLDRCGGERPEAGSRRRTGGARLFRRQAPGSEIGAPPHRPTPGPRPTGREGRSRSPGEPSRRFGREPSAVTIRRARTASPGS